MSAQELELSALHAFVSEVRLSAAYAIEQADKCGISSADFEDANVRALWGAVEVRARSGSPLDVVSMLAALRDVPRDFASEALTVRAPAGVAVERWALVREASRRRQYLEGLRRVAMLLTGGGSVDAAVLEATKLIGSWDSVDAPVRPMDSTVHKLLDDLEAIQQGRRTATIPTGLGPLDAIIGGLQPTLTVVGALPGVGKSAFVAGIMRNLADRDIKVGLLSLEDEAEWLTRRIASVESKVPVFLLANKPLTPRQLEAVGDAMVGAHHALRNVLVDDRSGMTASEVVSSARKMIAMGAKVIVVDHLGEVRIERSERHDLDITDVLRELRAVAKAYRVPVVVLAHLRRRDGLEAEDEPRLTDFAFSAGIERMARVALGLWRGSEAGELMCTVLKQTQGAAGIAVRLCIETSAGVVVDSPAPRAASGFYGGNDE